MFGQFEKSVYLCTRKSDNEELNGSVAQLNRASDYGSEGCGFESRRNHKRSKGDRLGKSLSPFEVYNAKFAWIALFLLNCLLFSRLFLIFAAELET